MKIVLGGGSFWGVEAYFRRVPGVIETTVGYANGAFPDPSYEDVCAGSDHVEAVEIEYDPKRVSPIELFIHLFRIIDPKSVNRQGDDVGRQYRTGIYPDDARSLAAARTFLKEETKRRGKLAVECVILQDFYPAESYHQDYLEKHPSSHCEIDFALAEVPADEMAWRRESLSPAERLVVEAGHTEAPFSHPYAEQFERGIYVDIVSGEILFSSRDKYDADCGWPTFTQPIAMENIIEREDDSHGMKRIEFRSRRADSHLGYVFGDGPKEKGGLRYTANGLALRFVPFENMVEEGYGEYLGEV